MNQSINGGGTCVKQAGTDMPDWGSVSHKSTQLLTAPPQLLTAYPLLLLILVPALSLTRWFTAALDRNPSQNPSGRCWLGPHSQVCQAPPDRHSPQPLRMVSQTLILGLHCISSWFLVTWPAKIIWLDAQQGPKSRLLTTLTIECPVRSVN